MSSVQPSFLIDTSQRLAYYSPVALDARWVDDAALWSSCRYPLALQSCRRLHDAFTASRLRLCWCWTHSVGVTDAVPRSSCVAHIPSSSSRGHQTVYSAPRLLLPLLDAPQVTEAVSTVCLRVLPAKFQPAWTYINRLLSPSSFTSVARCTASDWSCFHGIVCLHMSLI